MKLSNALTEFLVKTGRGLLSGFATAGMLAAGVGLLALASGQRRARGAAAATA